MKEAVYMAGLAAYRTVRTAELKSRDRVIEVELGCSRTCCVDTDHKGKQYKRKRHHPILWS